jgi:hypothetical protein
VATATKLFVRLVMAIVLHVVFHIGISTVIGGVSITITDRYILACQSLDDQSRAPQREMNWGRDSSPKSVRRKRQLIRRYQVVQAISDDLGALAQTFEIAEPVFAKRHDYGATSIVRCCASTRLFKEIGPARHLGSTDP